MTNIPLLQLFYYGSHSREYDENDMKQGMWTKATVSSVK